MKRIDYFWPRSALKIACVILLTQVFTEVVGERKPGFEWVLPACLGFFVLAILWTLLAVTWNIFVAKEKS